MTEQRTIEPYPVPSYSQIADVSDHTWHRRSCGIAVLKMVMDFLGTTKPTPSIDALIEEGLNLHAYVTPDGGWLHTGLVELAQHYGLAGINYDWAPLSHEEAFAYFLRCLAEHPLIASVTKTFSPSLDTHLIVVTGIKDGMVYVNNPDRPTREEVAYTVPLEHFLDCWTQRVICIGHAGEKFRPRYATWLDMPAA